MKINFKGCILENFIRRFGEDKIQVLSQYAYIRFIYRYSKIALTLSV